MAVMVLVWRDFYPSKGGGPHDTLKRSIEPNKNQGKAQSGGFPALTLILPICIAGWLSLSYFS